MVTISESTRRTTYQPTTPTTVFPVGYPIFDNDDLRVTVNGEPFLSFTVSATYTNGIATDAAINVTGPGITGNVVIDGFRRPRRTDQYKNGAPLKIEDHNYSLNRVEITLQELRRDTDGNSTRIDGIIGDVAELTERAEDAAIASEAANTAAQFAKTEAESAADRAEAAAGAINLPPILPNDSGKILVVNREANGYDLRPKEWALIDDFRRPSDVSWSTTAERAIAELQAAGGGRLLFGRRAYDMGPTLTIWGIAGVGWHNSILEGDGYGTVLQFDNTLTDQDGVAWTGWGGRCGMRQMTIKGASGKGVNWNSGTVRGGGNWISRFFMEDIVVDGSMGDNICFTQTYMGSIRNVEARNSQLGYGFKCNGTHTSMLFERCWAGGDASRPNGGNEGGWYLNGLLYSSLQCCGSDWNNGPGFVIRNIHGLKLLNCGAESNAEEGVLALSGTDDSTNLPNSGIVGLDLDGFGAYWNGRKGAGQYANVLGVITANNKAASINVRGTQDLRNNPSDPSFVVNGASGNVDLEFDDVFPSGSIAKFGSYRLHNESVVGKSAIAALSGNLAVANGVDTTIVFPVLSTNTLGASLSGGAIIIPNGVNRVKVTAGVFWDNNSTGVRQIYVEKNAQGVNGAPQVKTPAITYTPQNLATAIIEVAQGDAIRLVGFQSSGAALNALDNGATFLSVEAVG